MRPSSAITIAAATFVGLVLLKDGTLPTMISNGATFLRTTVTGLKPLTNVG